MAFGAFLTIWLCFVTLGTADTVGWEFTRGPTARALPIKSHGLVAVMVVHPMCPCSVASLHTLRNLVVRSDGRISAQVYFVGAKNEHPSRTERAADDIPDVDEQWISPKEAEKFGALTSGHVTLYREGVPIFEGGLSASRGVEGPSAGTFAIEAALDGRNFSPESPVFGCPLSPTGAR